MKLLVSRYLGPKEKENIDQVSAALMEYHCGNKDVQVASRIFEKGMETFGDEVEFVLRYLGFLISINDENSKSFFGFAVAPY